MPFYNVEHSFPLNLQQKNAFAEQITYLHSRTFGAPSIFVQVKYFPVDASRDEHYVGGVIQHEAANRIIAYVRSSSSRSQEQFDRLAEQIEHAWYVVVGERAENGEEPKDKQESSATEKAAKELLSIGFVPGLSGREKGFIIPTAGKEAEWFKQHKDGFQKKADAGDEGFKAMLEEVEQRDDLKSWR